MNKKDRAYRLNYSICLLMILFMIGYFSQGALYPKGTIISQVFLGLLFLFSAFFFIKVLIYNRYTKNRFIVFWIILLLINSISFIFKGNYLDVYLDTFRSVLLNLLPFFAFYHFAKIGVLRRKHLLIVFWILLPVSIIILRTSIIELSEIRRREENIVSNASYLFLGLIPFALLFKKKLWSYLSLSIIFVAILQSLKRASIIGGIVGFALLFYEQFKTGDSKGKYRILYYLGSLTLIGVVGYYGTQYFLEHQNVLIRMQLMMEGDSSGRDIFK